jgi:hypothetical protein
MPVAAFEKEPVKPLGEPLDLEEADLDAETLEETEFVVAL